MRKNPLTRRQWLQQSLGAAAVLPLARLNLWPAYPLTQTPDKPTPQKNDPSKDGYAFSAADNALLDDLESSCFTYFWEQTNPANGIIKDRCNARTEDKSDLGSIAATGFGLTALCIGSKREYISRPVAAGRALNTLRFLYNRLPNHRGFFYHWANINTGERLWDSEVSSVDTAILLCGVLTAGQYFYEHEEIGELSDMIFNRVDWGWLSEDTLILPHGWTPESGFLQYRWDDYSEMMMMYLLGLGSSSHPLPPDAWNAWKRTPFEYDGIRYIGSFAPLFVHQYSQAWFDFRKKRDRYADYFQNSVIATDVHRRFCIDLASQFPDYSDDLWGISASDSPRGYVAWGGPPATGPIDGTIVPCAAAGSLPFLPQAVMRVLQTIRNKYGGSAWSRYGLVDAFNPLTKWFDNDVIGIDQGITLVMVENARTSFVWETFMKSPIARRGMDRAGLKPYQPAATGLPAPPKPPANDSSS